MEIRMFETIGQFGVTCMDEVEEQAILEVVRSRKLFRYDDHAASKASRFEAGIASHLQAKHALAVCNGTAALKCALVACGVQAGDEVCVTPFTFMATVNAVIALGALPVFVDVDEDLGFVPADLERKISRKTRAILIVHLNGDASALAPTLAIAGRENIAVIEDAAQAFGVRLGDRPAGTFGQAGCFSLQSNKLIACGEGGFLVTQRSDVFERARNFHDNGSMRHAGQYGTWDNPRALVGENLKISELQAAVACAQLARVGRLLDDLGKKHAALTARLALGEAFRLRKRPEGNVPSGVAVPFLAKDAETRDRVVARLRSRRVAAAPLYEKLVYECDLFQRPESSSHWSVRSADCERARDLTRRTFWVSNALQYTPGEALAIADSLNEASHG